MNFEAIKEAIRAENQWEALYNSELNHNFGEKGVAANGFAKPPCRCPLHSEKKASFSVNLSTGIFSCQGCKETGDFFKLIQLKNGLSFVDSLKYTAEKLGMNIESLTPLTESQKSKIAEREARRQEQVKKQKQDSILKVQQEAQSFIATCTPLNGTEHAYLKKKCIESCESVLCFKNDLVLPYTDINGIVYNLQKILPKKIRLKDGRETDKLFLPGNLKPGLFFTIPGNEHFGYSEGFATGRSVSMATCETVLVCGTAHNVIEVIKANLKKNPDSRHTFYADDEWWKPEKENIGRKTGQKAAKLGINVRYPEFKDDSKQLKDFNDFHVEYGIDELKKFLQKPSVKTEDDFIAEYNKQYAVVKFNGQILIMEETEDGEIFLKTEDFIKWLRPDVIWKEKTDSEGNVKHVKTQKTTAWLDSPERRQYRKVIFKPGAKSENGIYNLWTGFAIKPVRGKWDLMRKHIEKVLCSDDTESEFFIKWCAQIVRHCMNPEIRRPEIALILNGIRGTGKDTFADLFGELFGRHYTCVTQKEHLLGKFNAALQHNVLCHASETFWAGDKQAEGQLKAMITNKEMMFESKYRNNIRLESHINLIISSNEEWVVPVGMRERRFFIPTMTDEIRTPAYFHTLRAAWHNGEASAMLFDMMNMNICTDDFRSVPETEGLKNQMLISASLPDQFWSECLSENIPLNWNGRESSEDIYNKYIEFCNKIGHRKRVDRKDIFIKRICKISGFQTKNIRFESGVSKGFELPDVSVACNNHNKICGLNLHETIDDLL